MKLPPEEIHWIRHTQMSIARHFGGITYNGARYVYDATCPIHGAECDRLIRSDVVQEKARAERQAKREKRKAEKAKHGVMI